MAVFAREWFSQYFSSFTRVAARLLHTTRVTIAYVRVPAEGGARETPVIFLHGGPGTPDMEEDARYFGQLARDGFDVYVYNEVGTGRSSRLADSRGQTLERDVADLEAVREKMGVQRAVLIGHSYGGTIAAAYAAAHPEHVARMVFSFPGDPSPSARGASMLYRLTTKEKLGVYTLLLPPRSMLAYALLQANPKSAHAFAGDAEMDARFDRVYNHTRPAVHCEDKPPGPALHGLGFYANQYPQSATSPPHADFLPDLAGQDIPTLIVKGSCDYLSWSSAQEYLRALPDARLAYLRGSGPQRLPGRARALHGRGAGVPAQPAPARVTPHKRPAARELRRATLACCQAAARVDTMMVPARYHGLDDRELATLAELGNELGITRERVRQLQHNAEHRLRGRLVSERRRRCECQRKIDDRLGSL